MAKTEEKEKAFHEELIGQLVTLATSGFGLVAALAWNAAIQQFVGEYIEPRIPGSGILSRLIYALIITFFAVLVTYQLTKLSARMQRKD
ncbi:DUF5654 family protein [Patescibacteria group bacterium]|nr:DUF5654 family protein [Patescibacteria group bacterium]MCL5409394.1 DUF5654 family protein [Patescibacteria group bacterium]